MKQSNALRLFISGNYIMVVVGVLFVFFSGDIIMEYVLPSYNTTEESYSQSLEVKWILVGHLSCALLALIIGPFQFWKSFRDYNIETHQTIGKIYVASVMTGAGCVSWLAWTSDLAIHWTWSVCLQVAAFFWATNVIMALRAILQRRIQSHKEWMVRSYVMTIIFVFFRWIIDLPFLVSLGSFIERAPSITWISFVIPLFITEIILQWNSD